MDLDVQKLLDNESFFLYRLYHPTQSNIGSLYFCGYVGAVYGGRQYTALPVALSDLRVSPDNESEPTITIGDNEGAIGKLIVLYKELEGFQIDIFQVKRRFLDDGTTPNYAFRGIPTTYVITQLLSRSPDKISYKLKGRVRATKAEIPGRIISSTCAWKKYRGAGCNYAGAAMFNEDNVPVLTASLDVCARTRRACLVRGNYANFSGCPTLSKI
jgi:lambda family phage minor tail protein L